MVPFTPTLESEISLKPVGCNFYLVGTSLNGKLTHFTQNLGVRLPNQTHSTTRLGFLPRVHVQAIPASEPGEASHSHSKIIHFNFIQFNIFCFIVSKLHRSASTQRRLPS